MKSILCTLLAFAALGWAGEPADRAAIQSVVEALNSGQNTSALFTADADNHLSELNRQFLQTGGEPFSEVTIPHLSVQSIRFITKDVALVDATAVQYGSTILVRRAPLLLVMRKEAQGWRIASLRVMLASTNLP